MNKIGTTLSTHLFDGDRDGPRVIECRTSVLRVHAAPWTRLDDLMVAGLPATPGFYLLTTRSKTDNRLCVRPGEAGDVRRRLLEHKADASKHHFEEVFCVTAVDLRLTKDDVKYAESRLHEMVAASTHAVLEVNQIPPLYSRQLGEKAALEGLIEQSRDLLYVAGCRALDAYRTQSPQVTDEREDPDVEIVDFTGAQDDHYLSYDGISAWGYLLADGSFVVRAGSDMRMRENQALLPPIAMRRRKLTQLGVLADMPGLQDRWRLLANVRFPSPLLAAKVITGAHISNKGVWQRLAPSTRILELSL
ncbi:hypothetical protein ASG47_07290 [Devosia sp. Leaf420]|uniref:hypothetical protein n=1 Tax=Devosia sp. Leaf420 TaxID=1736374 RepID=UPI0007159845|nr:hypothetical protein [Devosia sp. Leaf420]KQT48167.1 hypothetical protein ASG47_07290 [Devosia sp. Leaf420]